MNLSEFINSFESMSKKEMTATFNSFSVTERLNFLNYAECQNLKTKFISDIRTQAVKDFWTHEQSLLREGKSTRNWTPEQIEQIMNISDKTGISSINGDKAIDPDFRDMSDGESLALKNMEYAKETGDISDFNRSLDVAERYQSTDFEKKIGLMSDDEIRAKYSCFSNMDSKDVTQYRAYEFMRMQGLEETCEKLGFESDSTLRSKYGYLGIDDADLDVMRTYEYQKANNINTSSLVEYAMKQGSFDDADINVRFDKAGNVVEYDFVQKSSTTTIDVDSDSVRNCTVADLKKSREFAATREGFDTLSDAEKVNAYRGYETFSGKNLDTTALSAKELTQIGESLDSNSKNLNVVLDESGKKIIGIAEDGVKGEKVYSVRDISETVDAKDVPEIQKEITKSSDSVFKSFVDAAKDKISDNGGYVATTEVTLDDCIFYTKYQEWAKYIDEAEIPDSVKLNYIDTFNGSVDGFWGADIPAKSLDNLNRVDKVIMITAGKAGDTKALKKFREAQNAIADFVDGHALTSSVAKGASKFVNAVGFVGDFIDFGSRVAPYMMKEDFYGFARQVDEFAITWCAQTAITTVVMPYAMAALGLTLGPVGMVIGGLVIGYAVSQGTDRFADWICDLFWGEDYREEWDGSKNSYVRVDPLVIDLAGNGFDMTTKEEGAYFDLDVDGFAEKVTWTKKDGLLVLDLDDSGEIKDGTELFGDHTVLANGKNAKDGFEALAQYDDNNDGYIDSNDSVFSKLKVWRDLNGDGKTDSGELVSLSDLGIIRIGLKFIEHSEESADGAIIGNTAEVTFADGSVRQIGEIWATANNYDAKEVNGVEAEEGQVNVRNYGKIESLATALSKDSEGVLAGFVESFKAETSIEKRFELTDSILARILRIENKSTGAFGSSVNAKHQLVVEAVMGEKFSGQFGRNPNAVAGARLERMYQEIRDAYCFELMGQMDGGLMRTIQVSRNEDGTKSVNLEAFKYTLVYAKYKNMLTQTELQNVTAYITYLSYNFAKDGEIYNDYHHFIETEMADELKTVEAATYLAIVGTDEKDEIISDGTKPIVLSGKGDDIITGSSLDDAIYAGEGNDTIKSGAGNDTIWAESGDDVVFGGDGNDTLRGDKLLVVNRF